MNAFPVELVLRWSLSFADCQGSQNLTTKRVDKKKTLWDFLLFLFSAGDIIKKRESMHEFPF